MSLLCSRVLNYFGAKFGEFERFLETNFQKICSRLISSRNNDLTEAVAKCIFSLITGVTDGKAVASQKVGDLVLGER
jgi:hypothetical protein